jgi:hypothetical protein
MGKTLKEWIFTTDHKRVGVLYLIGSLAAFGVAGVMALLMRWELTTIGPTLTENPSTYNVWLYAHGAVMILGFQIPALTGFFANYCIPLMIGAKDVAFPAPERLQRLALLRRHHPGHPHLFHPRSAGRDVDRLPALFHHHLGQHGVLHLHRADPRLRLDPRRRELPHHRGLHAGAGHDLEQAQHLRLVHPGAPSSSSSSSFRCWARRCR